MYLWVKNLEGGLSECFWDGIPQNTTTQGLLELEASQGARCLLATSKDPLPETLTSPLAGLSALLAAGHLERPTTRNPHITTGRPERLAGCWPPRKTHSQKPSHHRWQAWVPRWLLATNTGAWWSVGARIFVPCGPLCRASLSRSILLPLEQGLQKQGEWKWQEK